jgi:hypothetical protein
MKKVGDFPLWAVVCGMLPAVVCFWLGIGYAGTFLVYLGVTGVLAILNQLDRIEVELHQLNNPGGSD